MYIDKNIYIIERSLISPLFFPFKPFSRKNSIDIIKKRPVLKVFQLPHMVENDKTPLTTTVLSIALKLWRH